MRIPRPWRVLAEGAVAIDNGSCFGPHLALRCSLILMAPLIYRALPSRIHNSVIAWEGLCSYELSSFTDGASSRAASVTSVLLLVLCIVLQDLIHDLLDPDTIIVLIPYQRIPVTQTLLLRGDCCTFIDSNGDWQLYLYCSGLRRSCISHRLHL